MTFPNDKSAQSSPGAQQPNESFRLDLTQDEFDRQFFGRVLTYGDSNTDVLRRQAELLSRASDHAAALLLDRRLAERCPEDPVVFYNLACSLSMTGHLREAIESLECAVELGYDDFAHIEADTDLDALRELPGFSELIARRVA